MQFQVIHTAGQVRLCGEVSVEDIEAVNRFLAHLAARAFSPATVRAYAFDLLNFLRFCTARALVLGRVSAMDLFDYLDWQANPVREASQPVVRLRRQRGAAPATMNRRVAAVRGLFEYLVMTGVRADNPVPAARRSSGLRASGRGLLGHLGPGRPRGGGRLVRQPSRLPEAIEPEQVSAFLADLSTSRDRAIVLAMVLGGLRAGEVRSLRLADVDFGLRRVRVVGKGGKERVVPVDQAFFAELGAYLREERPPGCRTAECFVVLRGGSAGGPLTEAGLRSLFRSHRASSGAARVRPHRLRHTYGTELASAGMDLLVLRDLMGHASPEHAAAGRLGWAPGWTADVLGGGLPLAIAVTGGSPSLLRQADIDGVREEVRTSPYYTAAVRHSRLSQLHSLARLLYEAGVLPAPPVHRRGDGPGNLESRLAVVGAPQIRRVMLAYLRAKQAVLKAHSIRNLTSHLAAFGEFLTRHYPTLTSVSLLRRAHIEAYCAYVPTRRWRGQRASDKQIGSSSIIAGLIAVRGFLDDITAWGWAEAPNRRLMFSSDIPRPPRQLPRALPPDVDAALMAAVADLPDPFARTGLIVMRGAGLRIDELLDLELDCVVDYGPNGHWLRVPLGKLNSERSIPLDEATLTALAQWRAQRGDDAYRKSPVSLIEFPHPVALMRLADCVGFEGVEQVGYRDGFSAVGTGAAEADAGAGLVAVVAPLLAVVTGVAG